MPDHERPRARIERERWPNAFLADKEPIGVGAC